ncbi:MAG: threonine dehydratase [Flavobacteriales bacterium]|nr:MAG: threonine dehydratase [Flavobacteriales bacterium]
MKTTSSYKVSCSAVEQAAKRLKNVAVKTPLQPSVRLSKKYNSHILLKREDLQQVRSYKIRGAYNKISQLSDKEIHNGIVCASAGNHAQGVAYACNKLKIKGAIFMPFPTPRQKIEQVKMFGGDCISVILSGDNFDEAKAHAMRVCKKNNQLFVHPFDDEKIIEGQATIALELLEQSEKPIDFLFVPVGGGGLAAGITGVFSVLSPQTKIIGVEPEGAASMFAAIKNNKVIELPKIDRFVDGAAVKKVGQLTFDVCKENLSDIVTVPEGLTCQIILELYNKDAIVVEPAGALSIAALDYFKKEIKDKNVICLISGSNNDITRTAEIKERALLYAGLKHYFIVRFPQRAGALKEFVAEILGPTDDITHFQYTKKHHKENGPAVVGIQLKAKEDLEQLIKRMKVKNFYGDYLNDKPDLFEFLV